MGRVQNSVRIDRPVSEVFAYVVDPSNTPRWNSTVLASTSSDASVRVGTTIRSRVRFLFREREIEAKVIALEPHSRLVTESLQPYRYTLTWTCAPDCGGEPTPVAERDAIGDLESGFLAHVVQMVGKLARETFELEIGGRLRLQRDRGSGVTRDGVPGDAFVRYEHLGVREHEPLDSDRSVAPLVTSLGERLADAWKILAQLGAEHLQVRLHGLPNEALGVVSHLERLHV